MARGFSRLLLLTACLAAAEPLRLDVRFIAQEKDGCGAASAAMVMQYWGRGADIDVRAIHRAVYSPAARGTHASELKRYLERQGFQAFAFRGEWSDLAQHLRKGRPLIVALKTGSDALHYVVVTGIEDEILLKHDAAVRAFVKQHRRDFEEQWRGADNWTLLALPAR